MRQPTAERGRSLVHSDPEAEYYQTVEQDFVSRRGDPLFLSNADWNLVRRWRLEGLPLRVVLRGIKDALDAHAHGWSRERKVKSLAYCRSAVEAAGERWRSALALHGGEGQDAAKALQAFAHDLRRALPVLGERARERAAAIAHELSGQAHAVSLDELTAQLAGLEAGLVAAIASDLGAARLSELEAAVEAGLERWRARLPARVLETLRRESLTRRLLEQHGLPRLSLFHLEGGGAV